MVGRGGFNPGSDSLAERQGHTKKLARRTFASTTNGITSRAAALRNTSRSSVGARATSPPSTSNARPGCSDNG